jgi:transmembrane sensor
MTSNEDADGSLDAVRAEAWDWILRVTSGDVMTSSDMAALERWRARSPRHAEAFDRASGRWHTMGPALEAITGEEAQASVSAVSLLSRPVGRRAVLGGMLAASAAGAVFVAVRPPYGLWPSINEFAANYRTETGEQLRIALNERLSVEMNTRTALNIPVTSREVNRIELVAGEAAVVTQSKPVEVVAADGLIQANDAQFTVRCDRFSVCVTCLAGSATVSRQGQSVTMRQAQQVSYAASVQGLGQLTSVDTAVVAGWRKGDLIFKDEPLWQVIEEINRYRPGRIVLLNRALGQRHVTARFKLDRLDVIVTQLQAMFGAQITSLLGSVLIVS